MELDLEDGQVSFHLDQNTHGEVVLTISENSTTVCYFLTLEQAGCLQTMLSYMVDQCKGQLS